MTMRHWEYMTLATLTFVALWGLSCGGPEESRLIRALLTSYDNIARPSKNDSEATEITHGFSLIQLLEFDQLHQILTIVGWEYMSWTEPALQWQASDYGDIDTLVLDPDVLWTPDIVLFNALDKPIVIHNGLARVTSQGQVTWVSQKQYKATCVTNPDEADPECLLKFGSWSMSDSKINLVRARDKIDAGYYVSHRDWELGRTRATKSTKEYPCCDGEFFSDITYSINLHLREPKTDDSDQDEDSATCPHISYILVLMSALLFVML